MKKVLVVINQHFDLMWRRCFDRDIVFKGKNYVSYAKLEAYYITDNLKYLREYSGYVFQIESPAVLKKFLENNTEYKDEVTEYIKQGRIKIPFTGNNIVDSNLIQGESIVRNFLYGYKYMKDNFGVTADGCDRNDAFGNSAQLPQIINGFGINWAYNFGYTKPDKPYWRGLDGSMVYIPMLNAAAGSGGWYKYRPCPSCNGFGCDECGGRGIDEEYIENYREVPDELKIDENSDFPPFVYVAGEEILPNDRLIEWIEANRDKYEFEFVGIEDFKKYFPENYMDFPEIPENEIYGQIELNPNNTGCYVTRIELKQKVRRAENILKSLEGLSAMNFFAGGKNYNDKIKTVWDRLLFAMFHDAVTATHVDAAYDEVTDVLDTVFNDIEELTQEILSGKIIEKENVISVINSSPETISTIACAQTEADYPVALYDENGNSTAVIQKDRNKILFATGEIKPFSKKEFYIRRGESKIETLTLLKNKKQNADAVLTNCVEEKESDTDGEIYTIENEYFLVIANSNGIVSIYDKKLKKNISEQSEYRPCEWILEHDEGSPWATLSDDRKSISLSSFTQLTEVIRCDDYEKLVFNVYPGFLAGYSVFGLKIIYEVILARGIDKVMLESDVLWDNYNHRLRVAVPSSIGGEYIYEIPYGVIDRKPYKKDNGGWAGACGDWPAVNFAGIKNNNESIALFNKGIPSYKIEKDNSGTDTIYLSVLRSPCIPTYLHDSSVYSMTEWDGMRDAGSHHFSFSIKAYSGNAVSEIVKDGLSYNFEPVAVNGIVELPKMLVINSKNSICTSMKISEDEKGLVIRMVEYNGNKDNIFLNCSEEIYETDMKEENPRQIIAENITMRPYEIKTIKLLHTKER